VTPLADRSAPLPRTLDARLDAIDRARASLDREAHRLGRIGFEAPLERCHEERRYWDFLAVLHHMAGRPEPVLADRIPAISVARPGCA
jgi:hypothetical protein